MKTPTRAILLIGLFIICAAGVLAVGYSGYPVYTEATPLNYNGSPVINHTVYITWFGFVNATNGVFVGGNGSINATLPANFNFSSVDDCGYTQPTGVFCQCNSTNLRVNCSGTPPNTTIRFALNATAGGTEAKYTLSTLTSNASNGTVPAGTFQSNNVTFLKISNDEIFHTLVEYGRGRGNYFFDSQGGSTSAGTGTGYPIVPNGSAMELNYLHKILNLKQYFGLATTTAVNATFSCIYPNSSVVRQHLITFVERSGAIWNMSYLIPEIEGSWERMGYVGQQFPTNDSNTDVVGDNLSINCSSLTYQLIDTQTNRTAGNVTVPFDRFILNVRNGHPFLFGASNLSATAPLGNGTSEVLIQYNFTNNETYPVDEVVFEITAPRYATFIGTRGELWGEGRERYSFERIRVAPGQTETIFLILRYNTTGLDVAFNETNITQGATVRFVPPWEANAYNPVESIQTFTNRTGMGVNMSILVGIPSILDILSDINNTVSIINSTVNIINNTVTAINNTVNQISSLVTEINNTVTLINSTVTDINNTVAVINSTVTSINGTVNTVLTTVTSINVTVNGFNATITNISTMVALINISLNGVNFTTVNSTVYLSMNNITVIGNNTINVTNGNITIVDNSTTVSFINASVNNSVLMIDNTNATFANNTIYLNGEPINDTNISQLLNNTGTLVNVYFVNGTAVLNGSNITLNNGSIHLINNNITIQNNTVIFNTLGNLTIGAYNGTFHYPNVNISLHSLTHFLNDSINKDVVIASGSLFLPGDTIFLDAMWFQGGATTPSNNADCNVSIMRDTGITVVDNATMTQVNISGIPHFQFTALNWSTYTGAGNETGKFVGHVLCTRGQGGDQQTATEVDFEVRNLSTSTGNIAAVINNTIQILNRLQRLQEFDEELVFLVTDSFGLQQAALQETQQGKPADALRNLVEANEKLRAAADRLTSLETRVGAELGSSGSGVSSVSVDGISPLALLALLVVCGCIIAYHYFVRRQRAPPPQW